jgi:N-acetylneuraminic acid mutarotase
MGRYKCSLLLKGLICAISFAALQSCEKTTSTSTTDEGNWIRRGDFDGTARSEPTATTLNGRVYAGLGFDGTNRLNDFWQYEPSNDQWRRKKDFPGTPRNSAVSFAANNKVYVGLGYDGINKLKDFWEYDPDADTWKQIADFGGTARYGASGFTLKDKGYVVGGYDGNPSKELWQYDPLNNTWILKSGPGSKRYDATTFVIGNHAYLVTGINNGSYINDFWMYDPDADTWSEKRKISNVNSDESYDDDYNIVRSSASSFVINGKAYVTIGINGGYTSSTWEYDPTDDTWTQKTNFQGTGREGAIGLTVGDRGFIALGRSSSLRFDDVREFLPFDDSDTNDD